MAEVTTSTTAQSVGDRRTLLSADPLLPSVGRLPIVSLAVATAALVLVQMPEAVGHLAYSPAALAAGESWRVLTCHLAHWSRDHAIWDALTFALVGSLAERLDRRGMLVSLALSALLIPPLVLAAEPHLSSYAGLSGLDVALYAFALTRIVQIHWRQSSGATRIALALAGLGLVAKVASELLSGDLWFVRTHGADFVPVPLAHLVGGLVGLAVGLEVALGRLLYGTIMRTPCRRPGGNPTPPTPSIPGYTRPPTLSQ